MIILQRVIVANLCRYKVFFFRSVKSATYTTFLLQIKKNNIQRIKKYANNSFSSILSIKIMIFLTLNTFSDIVSLIFNMTCVFEKNAKITISVKHMEMNSESNMNVFFFKKKIQQRKRFLYLHWQTYRIN
jgi:hypothetical protein